MFKKLMLLTIINLSLFSEEIKKDVYFKIIYEKIENSYIIQTICKDDYMYTILLDKNRNPITMIKDDYTLSSDISTSSDYKYKDLKCSKNE